MVKDIFTTVPVIIYYIYRPYTRLSEGKKIFFTVIQVSLSM